MHLGSIDTSKQNSDKSELILYFAKSYHVSECVAKANEM